MLNKCSNPGCNNHVIHNRYDLCPDCHKAEEAANPVKRHKCAMPKCDRQIPEEFDHCIPCRKARGRKEENTASEQHKCLTCEAMIPTRYEQCNRCFTGKSADKPAPKPKLDKRATEAQQRLRRFREQIITDYRSDKLRPGFIVVSEKEGDKIVISLNGVEQVFEDDGSVMTRKLARQRAIDRAVTAQREAELKLKADLLAEFKAGTPREGAKLTFGTGAQIRIAYDGKSYTMLDSDGAARRAEEARQAVLDAARRAEEARRRRVARPAGEHRPDQAPRRAGDRGPRGPATLQRPEPARRVSGRRRF
jgi:hypothetical protein